MGQALLKGQKPDGAWKRCDFPCPKFADGERRCGVFLISPRDKDGNLAKRSDGSLWPTWSASGSPDAPTLNPSVNCASCGYHGHVVNGELVDPTPEKWRADNGL